MILFIALLTREMAVVLRRPLDIALPLAFFLLALMMLHLSDNQHVLQPESVAGFTWLLMLLAILLSFEHIFADDWRDGSLEILAFIPFPMEGVVLAKSLAHWLLTALPLLVGTGLVLALNGWSGKSIATILPLLAMGSACLVLIGIIGAALTLGSRYGGNLLALTVLPLQVPILIVGGGAIRSVAGNTDPSQAVWALAALLLLALAGAPWAGAAAIADAHDQ